MELGELLHLIIVHLPHGLQVSLITGYSQHDALWRVLFQLAYPLLHLFEALPRGDFIGNDGTQSLSVVDGCNGVVLLLAGSVLDGGWRTQMASLTGCLFSSRIFFSR